MTIFVNQLAAEPGCYIAGHHGQYGLDALGDVANQFDIELDDDDDPAFWRRAAEAETAEDAAVVRNAVGIGSHIARPDECWDRHYEAGDTAERILRDATTGGYWEWLDGEFFLFYDQMQCDKCTRIGNREDLCEVGEECPMDDCDGTIYEYEGEQ